VVFKDGDRAGSAPECRSVDSLVILSTEGRAFTVAIASLPDGRGMGAPLSSFVDLGAGKIAHVLTGLPERRASGRQDLGLRLHLHLRRPAFSSEGRQGLPRRRRRRKHPAAGAAGRQGPSGGIIRGRSSADLSARADEAPEQRQGGPAHRLREAESLRAVIASHGPRVTIKGVVRNRIKTLVSEDHHVAVRARRGSPVGQLSNVTLAAYPE
jgi:topoisomerase-4 subunit A